ncbi:hypothetical protein WCLP8_100005 [uncultured Gammaproteobacteria bacterium]
MRGLFDSDGSVQGQQSKGVSVRLAQSDLTVLHGVQRMLLRLGIVAPSSALMVANPAPMRKPRRSASASRPGNRSGDDHATVGLFSGH